jgi:hypothetical protein
MKWQEYLVSLTDQLPCGNVHLVLKYTHTHTHTYIYCNYSLHVNVVVSVSLWKDIFHPVYFEYHYVDCFSLHKPWFSYKYNVSRNNMERLLSVLFNDAVNYRHLIANLIASRMEMGS